MSGAPVQNKKGTFFNSSSCFPAKYALTSPLIPSCEVKQMWLQQLSVVLETDVLMCLLGSGEDDFFGFGYELRCDKKITN